MASARYSWAAGLFAPWWLGLAFAVSFSADAGQDAACGASIAPLSARAPLPPEVLVPPSVATAASGDFGRLTGEAERLLRKASLVVEAPQDAKRLSDSVEPRAVLKRGRGLSTSIDRSGKADPVVGLRPIFEAPLRRRGAVAALRLHDALFSHDETSPVGGFSELEEDPDSTEPTCAFEPWPEGESPTTLGSRTEISPHASGTATMTMRPAALNERLVQGATPFLRRAEALASTTPARTDSTPVEVVARAVLPLSPTSPAPRHPALRARASVTMPESSEASDREGHCLAEAIYFEARGESAEGQAAVARVVLNRVASGLYPATICGVVYQNRHRRNACQFSFACDGRSLRVREPRAWQAAVRIAAEVTNGTTDLGEVGGSTHYHADYVRPRWARQLEKMDVIGHHVFYKLQSRQD